MSAGDEEIRVSWRAAVVPQNGGTPIYGRLSKVGWKQAEVKLEVNLRPGLHCNLALMPPKLSPLEATRFIEGRGVVRTSVYSASHFQVTVSWLELLGNGVSVLEEQIERHARMWRQ